MSGGFGIQAGNVRPSAPAAPGAPSTALPGGSLPSAPAPGTAPSALPPALTRVVLPARVLNPVVPKRPAEPLTSPRDLGMGNSPMSPPALADSYTAVQALSARAPRDEASTEISPAQHEAVQRENTADQEYAAGQYRAYKDSEAFFRDLEV
jgi:hypothetical protein